MSSNPFAPLVECTRGPLVESIHFGVLVVADANGRVVASAGDPEFVANLRSTSKPFQSLPLIENGGPDYFGLTDREIAITCASHSGTDDHVAVLREIQNKIGVQETNLQCGVHYPYHEATAQALRQRGELPTQNRHNCSGKHTGMLAQCKMANLPIEDYLNTEHFIQKQILRTFAEIMDMSPNDILIGIDGCSAPTFAAPLRSAAMAYARLADPTGLPEQRAKAMRRIFHAMAANPDMVAGPDRFDTKLMEVAGGKIIAKAGAEGYQGMAIAPGALGPNSPALGITYKVIDGDSAGRARPVAGMAILCQLGALTDEQAAALKEFDTRPLYNWRHIEVGEIRPAFSLEPVLA